MKLTRVIQARNFSDIPKSLVTMTYLTLLIKITEKPSPDCGSRDIDRKRVYFNQKAKKEKEKYEKEMTKIDILLVEQFSPNFLQFKYLNSTRNRGFYKGGFYKESFPRKSRREPGLHTGR